MKKELTLPEQLLEQVRAGRIAGVSGPTAEAIVEGLMRLSLEQPSPPRASRIYVFEGFDGLARELGLAEDDHTLQQVRFIMRAGVSARYRTKTHSGGGLWTYEWDAPSREPNPLGRGGELHVIARALQLEGGRDDGNA